MDPIYVTGHRNPDTDSIVAAIAYAALRNACGDREYEAACLGQVSEETQLIMAVIILLAILLSDYRVHLGARASQMLRLSQIWRQVRHKSD